MFGDSEIMKITKSDRGFESIELPAHTEYAPGVQLVSQSSAIGPYPDAYNKPGGSYLWVGMDHHLDREQIAEFVQHLSAWLETGSLEMPAPVWSGNIVFCGGCGSAHITVNAALVRIPRAVVDDPENVDAIAIMKTDQDDYCRERGWWG